MAITVDVTPNNTTVSPEESVTTTLDITTSIPTISAFLPLLSVNDAGGDGSLAYNSSNGEFTYTGPSASEVRAHLSAGTGVTYSSGQFSIGQDVATTADVQFNNTTVGRLNILTGSVPYLNFYNGKNIAGGLTSSSTEFTGAIPFYGITIDTSSNNAEAYMESARILSKFTNCTTSNLTGQMVFEVAKAGASSWSIGDPNPKNVMVLDPGTVTIGVGGTGNALDLTDLVVNGSLDINGNASIAGAVTDVTTLTASGEIEGGSLDINGNGDISGNLSVGNTLFLTKDTNGTLITSDNFAVSHSLLLHTGELQGGSLDINGNADISGNLTGVDTLTATTFSGSGASLTNLPAGELTGNIDDARIPSGITRDSELTAHTSLTNNPHSVTAAQVSLGNVTNESKGTMFTGPTFTGNPKSNAAPSSGDHLTNKTYVDAQVAGIVDGAPSTLNTLNEIAASLNNNATLEATLTNSIGEKLVIASNLSDLANAGTARTNLGLGSAATTDSTAYATAAQGTTANNALPASSVSAFGGTLIDDADAAAARTTLGLGSAATTDSTAYLASDGTAATATVTDDSTSNTDFPVVYNNESNGLLDDTGVFVYNPSTEKLTVPLLDVMTGAADAAVLRVGRNNNEHLKVTVSDPNVVVLAKQDEDSNGAHSFILNRQFEGTGLSDFRIQHDGNDEFVISDNIGAVTATLSGDLIVEGGLTSSPSIQVITGATTSVDNSTFLGYAGKRIIVTTTNALTMDLPDSAEGDEGKTWVIMNASNNEITLDADNNGTAQYFRILTGGSVITANQGFGGVEHIKITKGGIAELVCLGNGNSLSAPSYLIFGSGVHYE